MLFNSFNFLIFLPIVFISYWFLCRKSNKAQNILLLCASYFFYGMWDWRFLFLIIASTLVDFIVGKQLFLSQQQKNRKQWLWISIIFNLGILAYFKYVNFFIDSWIDFITLIGYTNTDYWSLNILLPVGISFYTFQTMSYTLDIYHRKLQPSKSFLEFATFVSFFPQLVAGPIEQASQLLPQLHQKRQFSYQQAKEGLQLILWGFFKKVAIADSIAFIVDDIFAHYTSHSASTLCLGAFLFSFQIYGDFSGYSDIAIGTAKLFGIELSSNFKFPYFSKNIREFWQRWHISLSNWFKYYVYIPLGGSKNNQITTLRNILIVFLVSGLWHGANWTFVVWGLLHFLLYIPSIFSIKKQVHHTKTYKNIWLRSLKEYSQILITFISITIAWIFFRAPSITEAFGYILQAITHLEIETYQHPMGYRMIDYFVVLVVFISYEYHIRKDERAPFEFSSPYARFIAYTLVIFGLLLFYEDHVDRSFIYFQF